MLRSRWPVSIPQRGAHGIVAGRHSKHGSSEARAPVACSMMILSRRTVLAFAALASCPLSRSEAGPETASPWVEGHRSRARLLDAGREGGSRLAALEIVLAPEFKTYWRTPGDSGVPPAFDWAASTNVASVEPLWP